jgi:hypothetical protein
MRRAETTTDTITDLAEPEFVLMAVLTRSGRARQLDGFEQP